MSHTHPDIPDATIPTESGVRTHTDAAGGHVTILLDVDMLARHCVDPERIPPHDLTALLGRWAQETARLMEATELLDTALDRALASTGEPMPVDTAPDR